MAAGSNRLPCFAFLTEWDLRVSMPELLAEYVSLDQRCGAVAQLGARVNGIHEVAGSIPASSTKPTLG